MVIIGLRPFIWRLCSPAKLCMRQVYRSSIFVAEVLTYDHQVLSEIVEGGSLTEAQAVTIVENVLFHTSNRLYGLGLTP